MTVIDDIISIPFMASPVAGIGFGSLLALGIRLAEMVIDFQDESEDTGLSTTVCEPGSVTLPLKTNEPSESRTNVTFSVLGLLPVEGFPLISYEPASRPLITADPLSPVVNETDFLSSETLISTSFPSSMTTTSDKSCPSTLVIVISLPETALPSATWLVMVTSRSLLAGIGVVTGVTDGVTEAVGATEAAGVGDVDGVAVAFGVTVTVGVAVDVGVAVAVAVGAGVPVAVGNGVAVAVGSGAFL